MKEQGPRFGQPRAEVQPVIKPLSGSETRRRGPMKIFQAFQDARDRKFVEQDLARERRAASNFVRDYAELEDFEVNPRNEVPVTVSEIDETELTEERLHARSILREMNPDELSQHHDIVLVEDIHRGDHEHNQSLPPALREEY